MTAPALLAMDQVACRRGGRLLFEGIDLTLAAGQAAFVTGPNGAGKSSLLRVAAGLLRPCGGTVSRPASIGFADEATALDERSTVRAALGFWSRIDGTDPMAGIEAMGLTRLVDVPVRLLSSGQRQRAALARVIAGRTSLWLLDEPANGLDGEAQQLLAKAMDVHRSTGGAIIAASHQPIGTDPTFTIALGAA